MNKYQNTKSYKLRQIPFLVFTLIYILSASFLFEFFPLAKFNEHKHQLRIELISQSPVQGKNILTLECKLINETSKKWRNPVIQVHFKSPSGELLDVRNIAPPFGSIEKNSQRALMLEISCFEPYKDADLEVYLSHMDHKPFFRLFTRKLK